MESYEARNLGLGILIGAAVGLGVSLLLAPRSGRETREYLTLRAGDVGRRARELKGKVLQRIDGGEEKVLETE